MRWVLSAALGTVTATGAQVVKVSGDPAAAAAELSRSGDRRVRGAPTSSCAPSEIPNDARFGELYGLHNGNDADMDISMSLGGGSSTTLQTAVRNATNRDSLIIAAAGNDGNATLNYPAGYAEVVSVAATDRNDQRASLSNANSDVEIAAAGVDVLSTKRGGGCVAFSGTSMATPHVAGVAALIAAKNPGWTQAQIRAKLDAAVDDKGAPGRDPQFGFGRVNLVRALS